MDTLLNKKVLLRECKRHTAHRIASARYATLSNGWGGYPIQSWWWGVPGVPPSPSRPGWGYPGYPHHPDLGWGTPTQTWEGVPPPPLRPGMGYPPQTWDGLPPPTSVDRLKILPSPILWMRAVIINTGNKSK